MANWTKKAPAGTSTRRKWDLEDQNSLKNLKNHFATNGCPDVQYDFAKELLLENLVNEESSSNPQAIYWLLCAARQGHEEALELLRDCYNERRGINDNNEIDVRECLSMSPAERAARKAARELFACLSNGEEHITPAQLERKMRKIYNLQKKRKRRNNLDDNSDVDGDGNDDNNDNNDKQIKDNGHVYVPPPSSSNQNRTYYDYDQQNVITEANLVTAAINYSHGRLPVVNNIIAVSVPHPNSLDHIPCFHRLIFHPIVFFTLLYHRFVNIISSFPETKDSYFKFLFIAFIYTLISSDNVMTLLPLIVYYISLSIMIWSTFKMLKTKHDFIDFRIWSGLFLSYGDNNVDANGSENQYLRNNMKSYLYFFCAFVTNLIIYPVISNEWLPHSEITVLSFILVFVTMCAFMYTSRRQFPDILILISFGVNVLAKYPYEMDSVVTTGWRFLDLKVPTFCSFVIGNGIEFCLNCRAVLYLLIPGILIHLARRSNWHGTYTYLIPHCVTLSWLQMCIISSQSATMFGLMRATLGLAGILLFLPLFGIVTLMIPIFVTVDWLGLTDPNIRKISTIIAAILSVIGSCLMAVNQRTQRYVTTLQVIVCIIAATLLTLPYMTSNFSMKRAENSLYESLLAVADGKQGIESSNRHNGDDMIPPISRDNFISWDTFYNYCGQSTWENLNKIRTQILCSYLEGANIKWEGSVANVEITKVTNIRASIIQKFLPKSIGNLLMCYYGEKNEIDCSSLNSEQCEEIQNYITENNRCNLNKWNKYEYEIKTRIHSGILTTPTEIYLRVSHQFENFTKYLSHSDRILFRGKLLNVRQLTTQNNIEMVLGNNKPVVDLIEITCITCHNKHLKSMKIIDKDKENFIVNSRLRDLTRGIKYFLNVLFNPILIFK